MRSQIVLGICITLLVTGPLFAVTTTFTQSGSQLWSNAGNWSEGIPGPDDRAEFSDGDICILDYDAGTIEHLALRGDGTDHLQLVDGAALTVAGGGWAIIGYNGRPEEPHLLEVLGGVLNCDLRLKIGFEGKGLLVIDHAGVVNVNDQHFAIADSTLGEGRVELRGGALNLADIDLFFENGVNSTASMDFSGGKLTWDFTDEGLALINDRIADDTITAYDGVGTVVVETIEDDNPYTTDGDTLVVKGLHPLKPAPEDGGQVLPGSVNLSWTLPDPCVPGQSVPVDVYFTDDYEALQSFSDPDSIRIVSQGNVTSATVQAVAKTRYYWAVDTYQGTDNDPVFGPILQFYADNFPPVVRIEDVDMATWIDSDSVDLPIGGTVTDVDPTTTTWTVVSEPNEGTAVIANPDQIDTTVTLSALGTYVLQLEADDGEYKGADTLTIGVFSDNCEAAKSLPGWIAIPGDINLDCIVDQLDLDILNEQWLDCTGLDCPDPNIP